MKKLIITALFSTAAFAGGGPDEGKQNKISDVPEGYKLVKKDAECKDFDPCAKEKEELEKLKKENKSLKYEVSELRKTLKEMDEPAECPAPKTIIKTVEKPVERVIEKPFEKVVTRQVEVRSISVGGMVAYSQDGIETSNTSEPDSVDAYTYRSIIGGPYINIPIGERFELGLFGMFGGINQTVGAKAGFSLK